MYSKRFQFAVACLFLSSDAAAQTLSAPEAFGARESVTGASLSPDGKRMSFIAPAKGEGNALYTVPVDGSAPPLRAILASGDPERLTSCGWVSNQRLACTVMSVLTFEGEPTATSRLVALNIDGSDLKLVTQRDNSRTHYVSRFGGDVLDWLPGQDGSILMGRWFVPEGSLHEKKDEGYGVERVDTLSLNRKRIENPRLNASDYISDGQGNVRIMGVNETTAQYYATGEVRYLYRKPSSDGWEPLGVFDWPSRRGFLPVAVHPADNVAYGFQQKDGRLALYKRPLDGSLEPSLVFSHPQVDVDGLMRLGRKGRIIGVSYATDKREAHYFDPEFTKLGASLARAIPNARLLTFQGASDDEQRLLIWAGSDVDPGRYYLFDRTTKQLRPIMLSRPELADQKLAPVTSVQVRAGDGTLIPAYLTLPSGSSGKGLPAIVMPHGGPSARDEWGFDWLAQFYASRGYAVLQPNYRGSSGYGDAWFQNNGFQSWRTAIGDVSDSGRWLVAQGIADPAKLAIVGWSYGGYAALQSGVTAPDLFKAIVAIAPVTDLEMLKNEYLKTTARRTARDFIGSGPHIQEGSPARHAAAIKAPVLMFHGDLDLNVDVKESKLMADRLRGAGKKHELVLYPGLDHYIEDSVKRADMLQRSDAFLRSSMGF